MVVLVPLFFWKWTMNPFIVVKTALFQSFTGIIILLWLALVFYQRSSASNQRQSARNQRSSVGVRFTPLTIGVLVFMSVLTISAFLGEDLLNSLWSQETRTLGVVSLWFFALLFLALSSLGDAIDWKKVWRVSVWTSLAAALGALFSFVPFVNDLFLEQGIARPGSSFGNPTFLAGYLLFNVFIGIHLFMDQHQSAQSASISVQNSRPQLVSRVRDRWLYLCISLVDVVAIFKTQTRGDIAGLLAGLLLIILLLAVRYQHQSASNQRSSVMENQRQSASNQRSSVMENQRQSASNQRSSVMENQRQSASNQRSSVYKNPWLIVLVIVIALGSIFYFTRSASFWSHVPGLDRIQNFRTVRNEFENRLLAWQSAAESFPAHPVFGFGWENFNLAFQKHYNPALLTNTFGETYWDKPHNVLIEYAITGGIAGLLAYLGVWVTLLYELLKIRGIGGISGNQLTISGNRLRIVLLGMLAAYFVRNLVIFDTIGTYLMFFLVIAFIDSAYRHQSAQSASISVQENQRKSVPFAYPFLVLSLIPVIFLNWQMVYGAGREYWIPNYYLNRMIPESLGAAQEALAVPTPYRDDIRLTFEGVINQGYQSGIQFPNIQTLQKKVVDEMQAVVDDHPKNYLFYDTLAEVKNTFHTFNPNYLKEASELEVKALELSPNRQQTYYVIGKTKALEGDTQGAYDAFKTAVGLNPEAGDPHFFLGLLAYQLKDAKTGDAEIAKAKALGRVPRSVEEATALGDILGDEEQKYGAAIGYYTQALAMAQGANQHNEIRLKIAVAYYLWGKNAEAKAAFEALAKEIDLRATPMWSQLEPVFNQLGIQLPSPTSPSSGSNSNIQVFPN